MTLRTIHFTCACLHANSLNLGNAVCIWWFIPNILKCDSRSMSQVEHHFRFIIGILFIAIFA
jgi:hypothetical protein